MADKSIVLKVQRPLLSTVRDAPWLVYDKSRRINFYLDANKVPSSVIGAMGGEPKGYFYARIEDDGRVIFGSRETKSTF